MSMKHWWASHIKRLALTWLLVAPALMSGLACDFPMLIDEVRDVRLSAEDEEWIASITARIVGLVRNQSPRLTPAERQEVEAQTARYTVACLMVALDAGETRGTALDGCMSQVVFSLVMNSVEIKRPGPEIDAAIEQTVAVLGGMLLEKGVPPLTVAYVAAELTMCLRAHVALGEGLAQARPTCILNLEALL